MEYGCRGFCRVPDTSAGGDGFGCESELVCADRNGESDCEIWGSIVEASVEELHTPTKVDKNKYTDTGKMVCKATS